MRHTLTKLGIGIARAAETSNFWVTGTDSKRTGSHSFFNFGVSGGDDGSRQNNGKTGDGTDKTTLYRKSAFVQLTGCSAVYFPASIKSSPCQNLRDLPRLYLGSADSIPCLIEYTHLDVKGL